MTLHLPDPQIIADILRQTGEAIVLPRFRALAAHEVIEKKPGDVVTVADIEAEAALERALPLILPGSIVIGEEAHHRDPSILAHLDGEEAVWIVDPIDGTANFTEGKQVFCMMLVLSYRGEAVMSWIHDPLSGTTAMAEKGAGAERAGTRLKVPDAPPVRDMVGQINLGFYPKEERGRIRAQIASRVKALQALRCAGHDFLGMAEGKHHFSVYRRLWTWDHAPGVLILREAGGVAERMDGQAYRLADRVEGLLSAPDPDSWAHLKEMFLAPRAA